MQQGGEGKQFADPCPQFGRHLGCRVGGRILTGVDRLSPGDRQFGACAIRQSDQVAWLRVGRVSGSPQYLNNLVVQRMMGMRHSHYLVIV
jgi:hypothetical protein